MLTFLAGFVLLAGAYLVLAGRISADEVGFAIGCGAAAALWGAAVTHVGAARFRFERQAVAAIGRAIAGVPRAVATVVAALLRAGFRRPDERIVERHFLHGGRDDPGAATRRAAALLAVSLAPDRFALTHHANDLRLHQVGNPAPAGDAIWPV
jgi:hypothetical protein